MKEFQGSRYLIEQENAAKYERDAIAQKILDIEQQIDQVQTVNTPTSIAPTYADAPDPDFSETTFSTSNFVSVFDHLLAAFALFPIFLVLLLFIADAIGVFPRDLWLRPFFLYIAPAIYFMVLFGFLNRPKYAASSNEPITQSSMLGQTFKRPAHTDASTVQAVPNALTTTIHDKQTLHKLKEEKAVADKRFTNFADGRLAEDQLANLLSSTLENEWSLFRNVSLKIIDDSTEDVDAILVGPTGIFALEVKFRSGNYRYTGKLWEYKNKSGEWRRIKGDVPSQQAKRNAARLHRYLAECNIDVFVEPRLVWANDENLQLVVPPEVPVWFIDNEEGITADISSHQPIPYETMEHIKKAIAIRLE